MRLVLGLESSCDETAVALLNEDGEILCNLVAADLAEHKTYGGVVPEIAARAHLALFPKLLLAAFTKTGKTIQDLNAIAVTAGPGLIGGVLVGTSVARGLALAHRLPLYGINHLEGHALTVRLTHRIPFPYLLLLVSGGHSQFLAVSGVGSYRRLGTTIDDAVGEAFDKAAKMLGLGYPGGPFLERAALMGDPKRFSLPIPLLGRPGCDLSLSGLKTALRHAIAAQKSPLSIQDQADFAASFQESICRMLEDRLQNAIGLFQTLHPQETAATKNIAIAGGVSANRAIAQRLSVVAANQGFSIFTPPLSLCGDNAAMIAYAAIERLRAGMGAEDFIARPRWPLDPSQFASLAAGKATL